MDLLVADLYFLEDIVGKLDWWTGANDIGSEGSWKWQSSLDSVGSYVLYGNEPNNGAASDCMYLNDGYEYLGADAPCTNRYHPICQLE